ncbi:hypothetical protein EZ428_10400 [Pedobacter frigiditerrae]|uniref:DUF4382 domain-containing protein n=1 Tax=Pedobacter frigiditerrae TaxID=2530452 RepID=A0A4R0MYX6_9SPHI|nr:DUF6252 family protein [Pedobacter frigiditerrae]TCC92133.1 hypothetical protein EZ428_10400 [Pedobacter frigiditerrae]
MKKIKSHLLLLILTTFAFGACQKDIVFVEGSGPGGTKPATNITKMSAKVDGVLVECDLAYAQKWTGQKAIQINGFKNPQAFAFTWDDIKGVGTYNAADIVSNAAYTANMLDPLDNSYFAESGTIKITTYNSKVIIGTFEFKAVNTDGAIKNITEGRFVINLEKDLVLDQDNDNSTFSVKIDGVQTSFLDAQIVDAGAINIIGITGNKTFALGIFNFNGPGTYDVTGAINTGAHLSYIPDINTSYHSISGKIIVTASTADGIVGTFQGILKLQDSSTTTLLTLTEGKFDVKY